MVRDTEILILWQVPSSSFMLEGSRALYQANPDREPSQLLLATIHSAKFEVHYTGLKEIILHR